MRLRHWFRRFHRNERLNRYPELRGFPRGRANVLVRRYQEEEQSTLSWRIMLGALYVQAFLIVLLSMFLPFGIELILDSNVWFCVALVVVLSLMAIPWTVVWMGSRMRKRIARRIVDELGGGRLRVCLKCGYDLRGTPGEVCSECGASVYLSILRQQ